MDFDFSVEQQQVKEEAKRFLAEQCGIESARHVIEREETHDHQLWRQVADLGWLGIAIPEQYGGLGLGHLELCLIAEEVGRVVAPIPLSSSIYLAAEALMAFGSEEQKSRWLPQLATGEVIGTFAVTEGMGDFVPSNLACSYAEGRLRGWKSPVPDGSYADVAIVVAADRGEPVLVIAETSTAGITRKKLKTIDPSRDYAHISFESAKVEPLEGGRGWNAVRQIVDRASVLLGFEQIGGADACLEMARDFALERMVFGRKLGSYQAIKHKLADMYVNNQIARSNNYYGAWALSANDEVLPLASALSRVSAIQAYAYAAKENLHVHGGMGFTWETDCHLFYRRSKQLSLSLGGEKVWKERLLQLAGSEGETV